MLMLKSTKMRSDLFVTGGQHVTSALGSNEIAEVEGTDYLLSSTIRMDDTFLQILGEFKSSLSKLFYYCRTKFKHSGCCCNRINSKTLLGLVLIHFVLNVILILGNLRI